MIRLLLIFYGKGKGKTTAAVGTAIRALGRGWKVLFIQFMKSWSTGERELLRKLSLRGSPLYGRIVWINFGTKEFVNPNNLSDEVASINMALSYGFMIYLLPKIMKEFRPKLTVFDELGVAIHMSIMDEYLPQNILKEYAGNLEKHAIVTGRYVPSTIREMADLITRVDEVRHYFRKISKPIDGLDL